MQYEVIKYCSDLKKQILELQRHLWSPRLELNEAYFQWKYEQNPYTQTPLIYLALTDGKVVGMRGFYGAQWHVGSPSQVAPCVCAGDLVIAPEHRNRGLFTQIMNAACQDLANSGCKYLFNFSAGPVTQLGSLSMGWRSTGALHSMRWKTTNMVNSKCEQTKVQTSSSGTTNNPLLRFDRSDSRPPGESHVNLATAPRPQAMASLVERTGRDGRLSHDKGQRFFEWRFKNPLSNYRFLFWDGSELEGYIVLQSSRKRDSSTVNIVDWEVTSTEILQDLVKTAISWGACNELAIDTSIFSEDFSRTLKEIGFQDLVPKGDFRKYSVSVLVRPVSDEMLDVEWTLDERNLLALTNWDLRMIYSDGC